MTHLSPALRYERLNRIEMQIDAIRDLCGDVEIAAKYGKDPYDAMESEAYADLLDAIYDLTEIEAVYEASLAVRRDADRSEEIAEYRRRGAHLRADVVEARS